MKVDGVSRVHCYGEEIVMGFLPCAHKGVHDLLFGQPHQVEIIGINERTTNSSYFQFLE
jgi:hypothetical protein